jgi:DNA-directed RNA polymerase subunit K/omega
MKKTLSRGTEIDTQKCVANCGEGRFAMVILASARAREIRRQHKESDSREHNFPIVTALLEIQEGKLTMDYMKKVKFNEPGDRNRIDRRAQYK